MPSSDADAAVAPSGATATLHTIPVVLPSSLGFGTSPGSTRSHSRIEASSLPVISQRPSGVKSISSIASVCPATLVARRVPVELQVEIDPSRFPVTMRDPSGLTATVEASPTGSRGPEGTNGASSVWLASTNATRASIGSSPVLTDASAASAIAVRGSESASSLAWVARACPYRDSGLGERGEGDHRGSRRRDRQHRQDRNGEPSDPT